MSDTDLTTTLPCPPWCVLPAGHPFYSLTPEGFLWRSHEGRDLSTDEVAISLVADETALSDRGPRNRLDGPTVWVGTDDSAPGSSKHDSAALRRIAAALLQAADDLDRVQP